MAANNLHVNATDMIEVTNYVEDRYKGLKPKFRKRALKLVPYVVHHANDKGIDPLLIAVLVSCESNWNINAIGGVGEKGLMQVHGMAAKGFDLSTPDGQLDAGTTHFRRALDKCGNIHDAIVAYATGSCEGNFPKANMRIWLYRNAVKKFRRK